MFQEGKAKIKIYDYIGLYTNPDSGALAGISGQDVANTIDYLSENSQREGVSEIEILINSYGGSVIDGLAIVSAMKRSKVKISTCIDGIAASMAGIIAIASDNVKMYDYSVLMLHNPLFVGLEESQYDEKQMNQIEATKKQLLAIYQSKSKLDENKVLEMMQAETWLSAKECKEYGFANEIVKTNQIANIQLSNNIRAVYASYEAFLGENQNKPIINKMEKIKAVLGVGDVTEDSIANSVKAVMDTNASLKMQVETLQATLEENKKIIEQIEAEKKEQTESRCVALVESAIVAKKINATLKDSYLSLARMDFANAEKIINALPSFERFSQRSTTTIDATEKSDIEKMKEKGFKTMAEIAKN